MKKEKLPYKKKIDEAFGIPECCMKCEYRDRSDSEVIEFFCTLNIMFPTRKLECKKFKPRSGFLN